MTVYRNNKFEFVNPYLNNSVKWKFDYVIFRKRNFNKRSSNDIKLPRKMYSDSVGYDLFVSESVKLSARGRALVCVELQICIPKGYFGKISLHSGLANFKLLYQLSQLYPS